MKIRQQGRAQGDSRVPFCALTAFGLMLLPAAAMADQNVTLMSGGTSANVDLSSSSGMNSWYVDTDNGQNQLDQQWFWYSVNGGPVQSIDTIANQAGGSLNFTQDSNPAYLDALYSDNQLSFEIQYTLNGGGAGSGNADISESIYVDNNTGSTFNLTVYQYSHFNLLQSANNSITIFKDPNNTSQFQYAEQTSGSSAIAEGIIAPDANYAQAGSASTVMSAVTSGSQLNDTLTAGPGDEAWAFEWNTALAGGGEFDIAKDKSLSIAMVPEPSTMALVGLGLGAFGWLRRRKSS